MSSASTLAAPSMVNTWGQPRRAAPNAFRNGKLWAIIGAAGGVLLLVVVLLGVILTFKTDKGTIVVEAADGENVQVAVLRNGEEVNVIDQFGDWSIRIAEGEYQLSLKGGDDRFVLDRQSVTVSSGDEVKVRLTMKPATPQLNLATDAPAPKAATSTTVGVAKPVPQPSVNLAGKPTQVITSDDTWQMGPVLVIVSEDGSQPENRARTAFPSEQVQLISTSAFLNQDLSQFSKVVVDGTFAHGGPSGAQHILNEFIESSAVKEKLLQFVQRGNILVVAISYNAAEYYWDPHHVGYRNYEHVWKKAWPYPFSLNTGKKYSKITWDDSHPVSLWLKGRLDSLEYGGSSGLRFSNVAEEWRVLARAEDGLPLMIECAHGAGRILIILEHLTFTPEAKRLKYYQKSMVYRELVKHYTLPALESRNVAATPPSAPQPAMAPFDANQARAHQEAWAKHLGVPVDDTNSIGMKFKLIPAGNFMMGSPESETGHQNELEHEVNITKPFSLGVCEVTQGNWQAVMGTDPWKGHQYVKTGANYPAAYVSWEDAQEFCRKLSAKEGITYRLPTDAEWEYCCRAGSQDAYSFGNAADSLPDYAWIRTNAWDVNEKYAHAVGQKKPNAFGLYDMQGNVAEWCQDWCASYSGVDQAVNDPSGPDKGTGRVLRGGSFSFTAPNVRSACRRSNGPDFRGFNFGFRVARTYP